MDLKRRVGRALESLRGLPLVGVTRSLDLQMFQFGERHLLRTPQGEDLEVGEWALHVQCPWRIAGPEGLVVGSQDRHYPEDEEGEWTTRCADSFTRCEAGLFRWMSRFEAFPRVLAAAPDPVGGFRLDLEGGYSLEVFPAHSLRGEYSEQWRRFRPATNSEAFILTGHGAEEEP